MYQLYSASGQILDIIGVVILFWTGLPFKMPERDLYIDEIIKPEQLDKDKRQTRLAYVGLSFLLIGFGLQLIGTLLSIQ